MMVNKQVAVPLDIINCLLSIILVCFYIYSTYFPTEFCQQNLMAPDGKIYAYPNFLIGAHLYFLIEYTIRLYTAKNFLGYLTSLESIIDLISVIPFLICTFAINDNTNFIIFFCRMLDIVRFLSLLRLVHYIDNDINS